MISKIKKVAEILGGIDDLGIMYLSSSNDYKKRKMTTEVHVTEKWFFENLEVEHVEKSSCEDYPYRAYCTIDNVTVFCLMTEEEARGY